ncbi:hypothetical protein DB354_04130 [Opitutus sp. ER46]|nr:hypothetical protein DB354_04130 [Opitutus sp. ER46]
MITLAVVAAISALAGLVSFRASQDAEVAAALAKQDALAWLRTDFQLSDEQFKAIKQLHESYSAVCAEHCEAIQDATRERNALRAKQADAATLAAADRRVTELTQTCETAIARHVRQCAALMSPEAGERYLALVLPRIARFDHQAPPDVAVGHRHH